MDGDIKRKLDALVAREQARAEENTFGPAKRAYEHFTFPSAFREATTTVILPALSGFAERIFAAAWWGNVISTEMPLTRDSLRPALDQFGPGDSALFFSRARGVLRNVDSGDPSFGFHGDRVSAEVFCWLRGTGAPREGERLKLAEITERKIHTMLYDFFLELCEGPVPYPMPFDTAVM